MQMKITTNAKDVAQIIMRAAESFSNKSISDWFKSKVDPVVSTSIMKNFADEGRPKWDALNADYAANRPSTPILVISGKLRSMFSHMTGKEMSGGYGREYPENIEAVPYYKYHQTGVVKTNLPQREIVGLQPKDIDDITKSLKDWIEDKIRAAGWR